MDKGGAPNSGRLSLFSWFAGLPRAKVPSVISFYVPQAFFLTMLYSYSSNLLICKWAAGLLPGARERRGGLSVWVRLYVCGCVCVSAKNTAVLLENRHEIALYRSASQFIFLKVNSLESA